MKKLVTLTMVFLLATISQAMAGQVVLENLGTVKLSFKGTVMHSSYDGCNSVRLTLSVSRTGADHYSLRVGHISTRRYCGPEHGGRPSQPRPVSIETDLQLDVSYPVVIDLPEGFNIEINGIKGDMYRQGSVKLIDLTAARLHFSKTFHYSKYDGCNQVSAGLLVSRSATNRVRAYAGKRSTKRMCHTYGEPSVPVTEEYSRSESAMAVHGLIEINLSQGINLKIEVNRHLID